MTQHSRVQSRITASGSAVGGWAHLSNVSFIELMANVFTRKLLMLFIFILIFGTAMVGVLTLKKTYTAQGKILVQFGEEYIYNPIVGTAGQGTAFSADQMIQAEVGFITAAELKERVLNKIGLRRLYPKLAIKLEQEPQKRALIIGTALHNMTKDLGAYTAPNQPLVYVTFRHLNPLTARDVLGAFIEEYHSYRREILIDDGENGFEAERLTSEKSLRSVNKELEHFLVKNGIGDFEAERTALGTRIAVLRDQLLTAQARRQEITSALSIINTRMTETPKTVEQYTDDASSGQLAALKLEREQLLAKYLPTSSPVKEINARIERTERYLNSGASQNTGTKRTGVNTIYQGLQTSKLTYEAEQQSNNARVTVLKSQISKINTRQRLFQSLFPEYQRLASRARIMEKNYEQFASREQELISRRNLASLKSDNIRVIEHPTLPVKGKSLKRPAAVLAFLFAMLTAFCVVLYVSILSIVRGPPRIEEDVEKPEEPKRPNAPKHPMPPPAQHVAPSFPYILATDPRTADTAPVLTPGGAVQSGDLPVLGSIPARR
ncbi:MAG: hypothetical protein COA85_09485 [Robiginitomaculum sp.]|nr:MAG: hypothetical protein COA85_09485 [Robiginitomaculum sp.]